MPADQRFDEKHLQDIVMAQSGQIRPAKRLEGPQRITRPVAVLTAIVAIVVISLGIKDYVEQQKAKPSSSKSTSTVTRTSPIARQKTTTSTKARQAHGSAIGARAPVTAQAAAAETEKPLISEEFSKPGTKAIALMGQGHGAATAQAANDEPGAKIHPKDGVGNELDAPTRPALSSCLPLPNGTEPGDVDAPYYEVWAREYCGL